MSFHLPIAVLNLHHNTTALELGGCLIDIHPSCLCAFQGSSLKLEESGGIKVRVGEAWESGHVSSIRSPLAFIW